MGLRAGGARGKRAHIHLVQDLTGHGHEQPGVRSGSTHIVVVLLKQFVSDCFHLTPGSLALCKSWNNVYLTEGRMPASCFDQAGNPVNEVGIRPEGQGVPVAYLWRVYELSTGET